MKTYTLDQAQDALIGKIGTAKRDLFEKKIRLSCIAKTTAPVETVSLDSQSSLKQSFEALDSEKTAEEIIEEIRSSRLSTRQIESF